MSLAKVRRVCRITVDSADEAAIFFHRVDNSVMKFMEHDSGLYVYNPNGSSKIINDYTLILTVAAQRKFFSNQVVKVADAAHKLYPMTILYLIEVAEQTTVVSTKLRNKWYYLCPILFAKN